MKSVLVISIGAIFGATIRYSLQTFFLKMTGITELGTLSSNLLGSFAIGFVVPILKILPTDQKHLIITGILGSLTTLSSFILECYFYFEQKKYLLGIQYLVATLVFSFLFFFIGYFISIKFRG